MSFCLCLMSMPLSYFSFKAVLYCIIVACSFKMPVFMIHLSMKTPPLSGLQFWLQSGSVACFKYIYYIILIRSNKMQQYAGIFCKISLHVSGVHRTHHQEYIKL